MDDTPSESEDLSIRCPECGQRFKVEGDFMGRMVECGSCDRQFRVEEEVLIRPKRFYPGERRDPSLDRFSRVPTSAPLPTNFEEAQISLDVPSLRGPEPVSPFRVILGMAGMVLALIVVLILIFGGGDGAFLDGASLGKRLVLAGFTALVVIVLLQVANPRARVKAGVAGLGIAFALVSLPFLFQDGLPIASERREAEAGPMSVEDLEGELIQESALDPNDRFAALKADIVYEPLAEALEGYGEDGVEQGRTAVGVWLRDVREFNKGQIAAYLKRTTAAGGDTWLYNRPPAEALLVLDGVAPDLERIAALCRRFGEVVRIVPELKIIEVNVDNESFIAGPLEKLQNPSDPAFYDLNRRELESIDLQRAEKAVRRLQIVEPLLYRKDIVRRMIELLREGDEDLKRDVAVALTVWAEPGDDSVPALRSVAGDLLELREPVPGAVMRFLVKAEDEQAMQILAELWSRSPQDWETLVGDAGPMAEDFVLERFQGMQATLKLSAARLLRRVGTEKSLPALKEARSGARSEMGVLIDNAIEAIENRRKN